MNLKEFEAAEHERFRDKPHGWIQWKGTDVCIDLHCACGELLHADSEFLYGFKCLSCKRSYALGAHVALHELTAAETEAWDMPMVELSPEGSAVE